MKQQYVMAFDAGPARDGASSLTSTAGWYPRLRRVGLHHTRRCAGARARFRPQRFWDILAKSSRQAIARAGIAPRGDRRRQHHQPAPGHGAHRRPGQGDLCRPQCGFPRRLGG